MRLYDIPRTIRETIAEGVDPDTGEIDDATAARLDDLQTELAERVEYLALVSREARAEAQAIREEEDRLRARRQAAERRSRWLLDYVHAAMRAAELERVEGDLVKVRRQRNSRPSIRWLGAPEEIPEPYRRVRIDLDGDAAYSAWREDPDALPDGLDIELGEHIRVW